MDHGPLLVNAHEKSVGAEHSSAAVQILGTERLRTVSTSGSTSRLRAVRGARSGSRTARQWFSAAIGHVSIERLYFPRVRQNGSGPKNAKKKLARFVRPTATAARGVPIATSIEPASAAHRRVSRRVWNLRGSLRRLTAQSPKSRSWNDRNGRSVPATFPEVPQNLRGTSSEDSRKPFQGASMASSAQSQAITRV